MAAAQPLIDVAQRISASAKALGEAIDAVTVYTEPAVARAVQAERNFYDRIDAEFGLLTSAEAGRRLGSRSTAPRKPGGGDAPGWGAAGDHPGTSGAVPGISVRGRRAAAAGDPRPV